MWQQLRAGIGQFHRKSVNRQLLPFPAVFQCLMYHRSWLCHSQFFQEVLRLSTDIKKGVSTGPGQTAVTVIPRVLSSSPSEREKLST